MSDDLAALITEAEAVIATFRLSFSRDHAKAQAINLLPRIVTALRQRPGREEARPLDDWHEDDGDVLWWRFPVEEPPWCGTPLDSDWPGYHTHWSSLPPAPFLRDLAIVSQSAESETQPAQCLTGEKQA